MGQQQGFICAKVKWQQQQGFICAKASGSNNKDLSVRKRSDSNNNNNNYAKAKLIFIHLVFAISEVTTKCN
ncbi:hypothetical protein [Lysinibacillus sp. NPDC093692]|uniref:hypothetical protein n=1 Tax=Lysinibacillus sp. NPDC093692 TaxID=3390578 RepID=UPI003CFDB9CC